MSSTLTSSPGSPRPLSQGWWRGCVAWGFCIVNTRYWRSDILPIPAWSRFLYTWWLLIYEVLGYIKTVLNSFPLNYQASSHFIYIVIGSVFFVLQRHIHTRPFLHLTAHALTNNPFVMLTNHDIRLYMINLISLALASRELSWSTRISSTLDFQRR